MTPEQVAFLIEVRTLIADEARWTRGAPARDAKGVVLDTGNDPSAICWCITGAIDAVGATRPAPIGVISALAAFAMRDAQGDSVVGSPEDVDVWDVLESFNDRSEHDDVIGLLDLAIGEAS